MYYQTPTPTDFDDVRAFNRAFLATMGTPAGERATVGLTMELRGRLKALDDPERARLSDAPFLLFSLRERDDRYWDQLHSERVGYARSRASLEEAHGQLASAALAYAWHMARRNPYTLRLVCCASLHWCERIAERTLVSVVRRADRLGDPLTLRAAADETLWQRLLTAGVDARPDVRRSTLESALQSLLIRPTIPRRQKWRSAACRSRLPSLTLSSDD